MLNAITNNSTYKGAGYDQIDVHACTEHDVRVSNVPTAVDDATADTNMVGYCLISYVRQLIS